MKDRMKDAWRKLRNAWCELRETSGWDHSDTRIMVRAYCLAMLLVTVGLTQVGCGGGQTGGGGGGIFAGVGNPPGPWPLTVHVSVQFPRRPQGATDNPGFRVLVQLNEEPAQVILTGGYDGYGQTDVGWSDNDHMRPGQHTIRVWMERADGAADPSLPSQTIGLGINNSGTFSLGNQLNVQLQAN